MKADVFYFSPNGTTEKVAKTLGKNLASLPIYHNVTMKKDRGHKYRFSEEDTVVFVIPVNYGRVNYIIHDILEGIEADGTRAFISVVFGNRGYDDALYELAEAVSKKGFRVGAAAAFASRHCMLETVGKGRPDEKDINSIETFAKQCRSKIERKTYKMKSNISGGKPYVENKPFSWRPVADDNCILCGKCAKRCPFDAIPIEAPNKTNNDICKLCHACIYRCPENARSISGRRYDLDMKELEERNLERKNNSIFL